MRTHKFIFGGALALLCSIYSVLSTFDKGLAVRVIGDQQAVMIICTVNQECMSLVHQFGQGGAVEYIDKTHVTGSFARRIFKFSNIQGHPHYVVQPMAGGNNHDKMYAFVDQAVDWLASNRVEIGLIIGFGTAGANTKHLSVGDIVIGYTQNYRALSNKNLFSRVEGVLEFQKPKVPNIIMRSTVAVPYNQTPKTVYGSCITVSRFVSVVEKVLLKNEKCFQMNDYISGMVAKNRDIPFWGVRTISDTEVIPESFSDAYAAERMWDKKVLHRQNIRSEQASDADFYRAFRSYYLARAAKKLQDILEYILSQKNPI